MMKKSRKRMRPVQVLLAVLICLLPGIPAYAAAADGAEPTAIQTQEIQETPAETLDAGGLETTGTDGVAAGPAEMETEQVAKETDPKIAAEQPEADMEQTETQAADGEIAIDEANFPDAQFRAYVGSSLIDKDANGWLTEAERQAVKEINVPNKGITTLEGIAYFPNLLVLSCRVNSIVSLDLSGNPELTQLLCLDNPLAELNIESNTKLQNLNCYETKLASLDLRKAPALQELTFGNMPLREIDLTQNTELRYLTYLGGMLSELDLSHAPKLDQLICSYSMVGRLDVSNNPELTFIGCEGNPIETLDFSNNPKLVSANVRNNELVSIHMGSGTGITVLTEGQRAKTVKLVRGETSYDLKNLDPKFDGAAVSNLQNARLSGSTLENLTPGTLVAYDYTSNGVVVHATLDIQEGNAWTVPLHIENWTYGETPSQPVAEAEFGTVHFLYGKDGVFSGEIPQQAGRWAVKAVVDGTDDYPGMEAQAEFEIYRAVPEYTVPVTLYGTYGDVLHNILLSRGFAWMDGTLSVGNVGDHTFEAAYTPEDTVDYMTVEHIPIHVMIQPKDGTGFDISPIRNEEDAEHIVIWDGTTKLLPGRDYTVTQERRGDTVLVTIQYIGNYTGTVQKSYLAVQENGAAAGEAAQDDAGSGGNIPKTGDNTTPAAYGLTAGVAVLILAAALAWKKAARNSSGK
ncbi:leucine-rich repeat domain-containing protein [Christensenella tenuis]|uniref:LPXTG cell wall anchor domain-containing protein n=1 Tax=Christensenella tenuis TaxID=2763033 RepID=A0ABR7ED78_9FIRM|nr:hypothetical protein [Christensenella tenuis]MBC5647701.1 hypothetical protein [Christensenella tenuis]